MLVFSCHSSYVNVTTIRKMKLIISIFTKMNDYVHVVTDFCNLKTFLWSKSHKNKT